MGSRKLLIRSSSTSTSEASEKVYLFDFVSSFEVCMYVCKICVLCTYNFKQKTSNQNKITKIKSSL